MEPSQQPIQTTTPNPSTATTITTTAAPKPIEPLPPQSQPPLVSTSPTPIPSSPNPNPNPTTTPPPLKPLTPQFQQTQSTLRPPPTPNPSPTFSRTWQQSSSHSHFSQFPSPGPTLSSPASSSVSAPSPPRGGMAIGVPASSPTQPPPFSGSFGQQFVGLGRGSVNVGESVSNSSNSQIIRPGMPVIGMTGSMSSSSQTRPGGMVTHHQQRPAQSSPSSLRPPSSPTNQPMTTQNFQGPATLRPSVSSSISPGPSTSQSMQSGSSHNQPWLSSGGPQGKPPLPPTSFRAPTPSMPQRSHIPQISPANSSQQHQNSSPQSISPSHQPQEHYGQQQATPARSITHQLQMQKGGGGQILGNQKPSLALLQSSPIQPSHLQSKIASPDREEPCTRILSKRSIHELVNHIDPSEKLDPEVEDILVDIAEDFVDSITTFGCSLAKHRKSDTLEAKDILLHLERNWNITLPGFGGDEIKTYRKPITTDVHKERLAAIRKSLVVSEALNSRNFAGHGAKGNAAKTGTGNILGSPNMK
ncbi:hypothetical protein ACFE04_001502 [Oxalis oulophora]